MTIGKELTEKSTKIIHHSQCKSEYNRIILMWDYSPDMIIGIPFSHITLDILYFVEGGRVWKMGAYNVIYKYNLSYVF